MFDGLDSYYILSLFVGIICKIYDDLFDNDLYDEFGIKNKLFVNELLKCLFTICSVIISLKNTYFFILFFIINVSICLMNPDDFKEYELAGLISGLILIPFLNYENLFQNINDLYFIILFFIGLIITEKTTKIIDEEYSFKKLVQRSIATFCLIIFLFFNSYTKYLYMSNNFNYIIVWTIGYTLTSSLFQLFLLHKNGKLFN
jgi:hypothetical protein